MGPSGILGKEGEIKGLQVHIPVFDGSRKQAKRQNRLWGRLTRKGSIEIFGGCPSVGHDRKRCLKVREQFRRQRALGGKKPALRGPHEGHAFKGWLVYLA